LSEEVGVTGHNPNRTFRKMVPINSVKKYLLSFAARSNDKVRPVATSRGSKIRFGGLNPKEDGGLAPRLAQCGMRRSEVMSAIVTERGTRGRRAL
jgi:hypothetical protein